MTTAVVAAVTALVVFGLTSYRDRRHRWEDRRGEAYVEMLTLVQQIMAEVNPWRPWVGDYGPTPADAADLTLHQRATIRAKVQVWGSAPVRDLLTELQNQFRTAERGTIHRETVTAEHSGEVAPDFMDDYIGGIIEEMDSIVERLENLVRSELQPEPTWLTRVRTRLQRRRKKPGSPLPSSGVDD